MPPTAKKPSLPSPVALPAPLPPQKKEISTQNSPSSPAPALPPSPLPPLETPPLSVDLLHAAEQAKGFLPAVMDRLNRYKPSILVKGTLIRTKALPPPSRWQKTQLLELTAITQETLHDKEWVEYTLLGVMSLCPRSLWSSRHLSDILISLAVWGGVVKMLASANIETMPAFPEPAELTKEVDNDEDTLLP